MLALLLWLVEKVEVTLMKAAFHIMFFCDVKYVSYHVIIGQYSTLFKYGNLIKFGLCFCFCFCFCFFWFVCFSVDITKTLHVTHVETTKISWCLTCHKLSPCMIIQSRLMRLFSIYVHVVVCHVSDICVIFSKPSTMRKSMHCNSA